jgi:excisionase family DNA binding protein
MATVCDHLSVEELEATSRRFTLILNRGLDKIGESWHSLATFPTRGQAMPDEILTLPEVAQLLKVAEKTVYPMAQKSQLPAFKVGGQWRFKRVDIDRWIQKAHFLNEGRS